jgi:hypothetical protein
MVFLLAIELNVLSATVGMMVRVGFWMHEKYHV